MLSIYICFQFTVPEILDKATSYIKQLQENEERLKRRKEQLKGEEKTTCNTSTDELRTKMTIRHYDSTVEVNLICALDKNFLLHEVISVLQEEAAEVVEASQHTAGDKLIFIIKSKVRTYMYLLHYCCYLPFGLFNTGGLCSNSLH